MGVKSTAINQPHASLPSQEASHAHNTPVEPSNPSDPHLPSDLPQTPAVDSCPSMDVKSLIQFFNNRSTTPVTKPPTVTREPVYNLNGKVRNLVREFSKSTRSLPDPKLSRPFGRVKKAARTTQSEPAIDQVQNGGIADGAGVFQVSGGSRQVPEEGNSAGYVIPIQHSDPPKQADSKDQSEQQPQEPAQAAVDLVQDVTRTEGRPTRPQPSEWKRAQPIHGINATSTASHSETPVTRQWNRQTTSSPIRLNDMLSTTDSPPAIHQVPGSIDSVVMSAKNSELRRTRSMVRVSSGRGRYGDVLSPLGLETVEERLVPRTPNKSTEPPPLKIVKVRKFSHEGQMLAPPKVPFLAPPAQRFVQAEEFTRKSQASSASNSVSISPGRSISHKQPVDSPQKKDRHSTLREAESAKGETNSQASRSMYLIASPIERAPLVEQASTKHRGSKTRVEPDTLAGTSPIKLESKRAYQIAPHRGAPRMRIYEDSEWMSHGQALRKTMYQTDGDAYSVVDTLDGLSVCSEPWSPSSPLEDSSSVAETSSLRHNSPLSPPRAPFKRYIISPGGTAGKYYSLPGRKIELIRPLPDPFFAEQIGLQPYNPRFSTFTKQEGSSDASLATIDHEALSVGSEVGVKSPNPPMEAKDPRSLGSAHKSPIQRVIAREHAASRAAGLTSPSYVVAGLLGRALSRTNSVDMENKRYSSRRRQ